MTQQLLFILAIGIGAFYAYRNINIAKKNIDQYMSKEKKNTIADIKNIIEQRNPYDLEEVLSNIELIGDEFEYIDLLNMLLIEDWHFMHEDIVRYLQKIKSPKSIDVLFKTIFKKFNYLEYNNSESLARKCIWALADIGNDKAKHILLEVANYDDDKISSYAQKRIDNWEKEQDRKSDYKA